MSTVPISSVYISEEDYLAGEELSVVKHEYLGGVVHAMAGASEPHTFVEANLAGLLFIQLRGKRCQALGSNMKLKLNLRGDSYYYYPDAMVACDATDSGHGWRERPTVIFEILSETTRHIDEREKRMAYHQIDQLRSYVRIEQSKPEIIIERRIVGGWEVEVISGLDGILRLPEIAVEIPLAELYERMTF